MSVGAGAWDGLRLRRSAIAGYGVGSGAADPHDGGGADVLWIHGYTMTSAVWDPLWGELPGRRHLGIDLPFHGGSRPLRRGEGLAPLADSIAALVAAKGVGHVVALSLGTVVALEMAARHPGLAASWTLAAPALAGMPHEPAVRDRYRDLAARYAERGAGSHLTDLWMSSPPEIFAGLAARANAWLGVRAVIQRHQWRELESPDWRNMLSRRQSAADIAEVEAPVAILTGERDLLVHRACARDLARASPRVRLDVMTRCGHLPLLEEPERSAALLTEFWRDADRPAPPRR